MAIDYGVAFELDVPLYDLAGAPAGVAAALSISKDGAAAFTPATNAATAIAGYGCHISLTASEMTAGSLVARLTDPTIQQQVVGITTDRDAAPTTASIAAAILVTPANKVATDASGNVTAGNMRGTDNANTIAPLDATATANAAATGADAALTAAGIATTSDVEGARDAVIAEIPRGPGLVAFTYELGEDRDGDGLPDRDELGALLYPIAQAYVYATATDSPDLAGMLDGGHTNALGAVTLHLPVNPETYFWRHKTGRINFANPDIEDVS